VRTIEPVPTPPASAATAPTPAQTAPAPAPQRSIIAPSFDVVRVNPRGEAVIAGRAEPGAEVTVYSGEKKLGAQRADARGEWVILPAEPLEPGVHELSASAVSGDVTVRSSGVAILVVPSRDQRSQPPLAVVVPRADESTNAPALGARVVQAPPPLPSSGAATGSAVGTLGVQAIEYTETGQVAVSGKGAPNAEITIYLDGKLMAIDRIDANGAWRVEPSAPIPPGLYQMRVDQSGADGKVTARIELPFQRVDAPKERMKVGSVVIQPGDNLWRIARSTYGRGIQYVVIYQANRDSIRDPDLIYPGQIFTVPVAP
jgi:nucleoid-associated protein YgaU